MNDNYIDLMVKEIDLRGLDDKTKTTYLRSMRCFLEHYKKDPNELELDDLKRYQIYLLKHRRLAPNSVNKEISAIKFYYMHVLERYWYTIALPRVRAPKKIPVILSEEEVANLINSVHNVMYKAIIMVMYSSGLRNAEVCTLKTVDIDSKRMVIDVRDGKGHRDGQALLAEMTLRCLRTYWRLFRRNRGRTDSDWLFVASKIGKNRNHDNCLSHTAIGYVIKTAIKASGIKKKLLPMSCVTPLQFT